MGTKLTLDVNYPYMARKGYTCYRTPDQLVANLRNAAYVWPSRTMTLMPACFKEDYHVNPRCESLKLGPTEYDYDSSVWQGVFKHSDSKGVDIDYWLNLVVSADRQTEGEDDLLSNLPTLSQTLAALRTYAGEDPSQSWLCFLRAKAESPMNQGYHICFRSPGLFWLNQKGTLFLFQFGPYAIRFTLGGMLYLYRTVDGINYAVVGQTQWADPQSVYNGGINSVTIYPHSYGMIEIVCWSMVNVQKRLHWGKKFEFSYPGWIPAIQYHQFSDEGVILYKDPLAQEVKSAGYSPLWQTLPAHRWSMAFATSFRPQVQVARLGFETSTFSDVDAQTDTRIWDLPQSLSNKCITPFQSYVVANIPDGARIQSFLDDYDQKKPFVSDGSCDKPQFSLMMAAPTAYQSKGLRGYASSSPEMYGYVLRVDPIIRQDDRTPVDVDVVSYEIQTSSDVESESLTAKCHLEGALLAFENRSYIPYRLWDDVTHTCYSEGFFDMVDVDLSPAQGNVFITFHGRGMQDPLLREFVIDLDFTSKADGTGWMWGDAIIEAFGHGGYTPDQISIQNRLSYDFPLWPEGDQTTSSSGKVSQTSQRWKPLPNSPIFDWIDTVIRKTLGWTWCWVKATWDGSSWQGGYWYVYKRPRPSEIAVQQPVAAFFSTLKSMMAFQQTHPGIPCYTHSALKMRNQSPTCTSILGVTFLTDVGATQGMLSDSATTDSMQHDSSVLSTYGQIKHPWINPNGYKGAFPKRDADVKSVDYMGRSFQRVVNLTFAGRIDAFTWIGRRAYEDLCFGTQHYTFESYWGDAQIVKLKRWDKVLIDPPLDYSVGQPDMGECLVDDVRVKQGFDVVKRADYRVWRVRPDAAPPR